MSDWIIKVEHLAKRYRLRHKANRENYVTLRDTIVRGCKSVFSRSKSAQQSEEDFWAIKDISFEIEKGAVVGVIGRNGAGKSTLLKILSRITAPTEGRIRLRGRVASLLEVGTGFHPELTGRENIFLNGAILGMTKAEIRRKFDEIVDFSEIETFLDTPVKRYSSGMYVRLAFAVAAHLEPEVLIVDEVLAVGDAEFQKKCLGKMHDVATTGRTVLFVSHNLQAVSLLCSRAMLLRNGSLAYAGGVKETIDLYVSTFTQDTDPNTPPDRRSGSGEYRFTRARPAREYFGGAEEKTIHFEIERRGHLLGKMWLSAFLVDSSGMVVTQCDSRLVGALFGDFKQISGQLQLRSPWLKPGVYRVDLFICADVVVDMWEGACAINIYPVLPYSGSVSDDGVKFGLVFSDFSWETSGAIAGYKVLPSKEPLKVVGMEEVSS
jgi:lipopolysaccharide transport system ATP-binding protein